MCSSDLFYDAAGSALFEQITALPEYYLTRTETAILDQYADAMVSGAGDALTLVELGAGTAAKTRIVIRALLRRQRQAAFYPVDVSPAPLEAAAEALPVEFRRLRVRPVVADYTAYLSWLREIPGRKLVLYIGSSIGNFPPESASGLLARFRHLAGTEGRLLVGFDLRKIRSGCTRPTTTRPASPRPSTSTC